MLTKFEIYQFLDKTSMTEDIRGMVELILRNFADDDLVAPEKLEAICKLIIKK